MKKYLKILIPHSIQKNFCQSSESNFIQFLKAVSKTIFVLSGRIMFIKFIHLSNRECSILFFIYKSDSINKPKNSTQLKRNVYFDMEEFQESS